MNFARKAAEEWAVKNPHADNCSGWDGFEAGWNAAIRACVVQLGGRYGAAATHDLRVLLLRGDDEEESP